MLCLHQRWRKGYNTRRTMNGWGGRKHSQFPLNILVFVWVNSGRSRKNISEPNTSEDTEVKVIRISEWARSILYHVAPKILYVKIFGKYE
jgi:hypothetical protein